MKKLLIFLMIAIPLAVILIVNVTVDAVVGIVIIPVDSISIVCDNEDIEAVYDESNSLARINIEDSSRSVKLSSQVIPSSASNKLTYWESADESVALVDSYGNVSFVGFGTAEVYAISSDGTKKSSCLFVVTDTRVHDINIYAEDTVLEIGSTTTVWARVFPSTAVNQEYTFTSSNPNVVSINSAGIATAISAGEATIIATASDGSIGYNCTASLTINVVKSVEAVRLTHKEKTLVLATSEIRLTAKISPSDASNKQLTYTTTNPLVATVSNSGVVKFSNVGTVVITVISDDGGFTDSIELTYTGGYPISLEVENKTIEANVSTGSVYEQINYSFSPENPPTQNITFTSNNESVATVNEKGLIHIFGGGSATIAIEVQTSDNHYYLDYIDILSVRKVDEISFESSSVVSALPTYTIKPVFNPIDATDVENLTFEIISGGDLATVSPSGVVSFTSVGEVVVKVTDTSQIQTESVFNMITVAYTGGYPFGIRVDNENIEIDAGTLISLSRPIFYPIETSITNYTFKILSQAPVFSGDTVILLNEKGEIEGVSGGTALIELSVESGTDTPITKTINIKVNQDITEIVLECDKEIEIYEDGSEKYYISANNTFDFNTHIYPLDATNSNIVFELSNTNIATILNNNQIFFNEAGQVKLTVYSKENNNIKSELVFWYTGSCAVDAKIEGIPTEIVNGCDPFVISLKDFVPKNATNQSFKVDFLNQTSENMFSVSYNSEMTEATIYVLKSGSATLSIMLASAGDSNKTWTTMNVTVLQKTEHISFAYPSQTISSTQFILQCEMYPSNATQTEITYTLGEAYKHLASINGNMLTFNPSEKESETVVIVATLIDIDGNVHTDTMELTTTFGTVTSPEGNKINLSIGNNVEYDYSDKLTSSTLLNIIIKDGEESIDYNLSYGRLIVSALAVGQAEIEVQLLNKSTNDVLEILANLEITISVKTENITISSPSLTRVGNRYVTAQNDICLNINVFPTNAPSEGLIVTISNPSIATFEQTTGILHFNAAGTVEILIASADGACSRSFTLQYTNGLALSSTLNIESVSSFYVTQNYFLELDSYTPTNANLSIIEVRELVLSGGTAGVETEIAENGIMITFNKAGIIRLEILLSDGSQKTILVNVVSILSEIIFDREVILTASSSITLSPILLPTTATDKSLIYTSSDTGIATVTPSGVVTFLKAGSVTITARSANNESVFSTCNITSTMGDVSQFTINYTNLTLAVGETRELIVNSFLPTNASNRNFIYEILSWTTNDGSLTPTISITNTKNGIEIVSLKGGEATIKIYIVTQNGEIISQTCNIVCIRELTNVSLSFDRQLDTYQNYFITSISELALSINLTPTDATVTYQSVIVDNPNIAKIEDGKLIFLSEGVIKLTAIYNKLNPRTITIRYTKSAVSFEIDGDRNITLAAGTIHTVNVKNVIPSDLVDKTVSLQLYLSVPNHNNDTVCSANNNVITGVNGGSALYNISISGSPSQTLEINVVRLASSIITETDIKTPSPEYPLSAYAYPYDTSDKTLTYTVLYPSTGVSVDDYGKVVFSKELTATIRITNPASGMYKDVSITYDPGAKEIKFENTIRYVFIGGTLKLLPKITPYHYENEQIEWSVSDSSLATISSDGVLTPKRTEGVVIVTAKLKNHPDTVASISISIHANVYSIAFDLNNKDDETQSGILGKRVFGVYSPIGIMRLAEPKKETKSILSTTLTNKFIVSIKTLLHNASAIPSLVWTTSDPSIATIENGVLTVLKPGVVTVTCSPAKQYDPNKKVIASYTFTFIEGINIDSIQNFSVWRDATASDNFSKLPMVLQGNLIFAGEKKSITKDIYGNGFRMDLQLQVLPSQSPFMIDKSVTINNVYFRGYSFGEGDSLAVLLNVSNVVQVVNKSTSERTVVFKNCIIDGGRRGLLVSNSNVTMSGCIVKNAYYGAIVLDSSSKKYPQNILTLNNSILENSLLGSVLNLTDKTVSKSPPLVTFNGSVYLFNWQDLSQYSNFTLGGDFAALNGYLESEITFLLSRYDAKFKTVGGVKYAHFGVLSPNISVNLGVVSLEKQFECQFVDNSNFGYAFDVYENSIGIGYYILNSYGFNNSSTSILPKESYTDDTLGYYKKIRDMS